MSNSVEPGQPTEPEPTKGHRKRWPIIALVVAGIAAAGLIGYALGGNSRDDDVTSAEAQAAKASREAESADADAAAAQQAREQDDANDEQATQAIQDGFDNLGNAIANEEAKDDKAAQQAVDDATKQIGSGLEQLGADLSKGLDQALSDLQAKVNDAAGSGTPEAADSGG